MTTTDRHETPTADRSCDGHPTDRSSDGHPTDRSSDGHPDGYTADRSFAGLTAARVSTPNGSPASGTTTPGTSDRDATNAARYVPPVARMDRWSQVAIRWLAEHGVSLLGSRVLTVLGRSSGEPRRVVVNLMELDGERYLVSPRGNTQWVRNVRAAGIATLSLGRRDEEVVLTELPVAERAPVLRVYLDRWGWEVGRFVEGLTKDSTDAELAAAAPGFPVLRVTPAPTPTP